jgi:hypothetical protein
MEQKDRDTMYNKAIAKNGGYAFPAHQVTPEALQAGADTGMTLLDYFIGQALIGTSQGASPEYAAKQAVRIAKAAVIQRNKLMATEYENIKTELG